MAATAWNSTIPGQSTTLRAKPQSRAPVAMPGTSACSLFSFAAAIAGRHGSRQDFEADVELHEHALDLLERSGVAFEPDLAGRDQLFEACRPEKHFFDIRAVDPNAGWTRAGYA